MQQPATPDEPLTESDFRRLAEGKRAVALAIVDNKKYCHEAWDAAGFAVEYALKALIMRRRRYNSWPSPGHAKELHTHNLRILLREAGIETKDVPSQLRGSLRAALDWERAHAYTGRRLPRAQAKSMVKAVFGDKEVLEWLNQL